MLFLIAELKYARSLYNVYQHASARRAFDIVYRHISPEGQEVRRARRENNGLVYIYQQQPTYWPYTSRGESSFGHGCSRWHAIPRADYARFPIHPSLRTTSHRVTSQYCAYVYEFTEASPTAHNSGWRERRIDKEREREEIECQRVDVWPVLFRDCSDRARGTGGVSLSLRARSERETRRSERDARAREGRKTRARLSPVCIIDTSQHARRRPRLSHIRSGPCHARSQFMRNGSRASCTPRYSGVGLFFP